MRRHAKASPPYRRQRAAGSTTAGGRKARGLFGLLCLFVLGLTAIIAGAGAPAAGAVEGEGCANEDRRLEQHSTYLPDCRAYEMVSPVDKNLGDVIRVPRAADDGNAVAIGFIAGLPGSGGNHVNSYMVAKRGDGGWSLKSADAPGLPYGTASGSAKVGEPNDFDTSFSKDVETVEAPLVPDAIGMPRGIYGIDVGSANATWLSAPQGVAVNTNVVPYYGSASADLSRVFFTARPRDYEAPSALLPGAPAEALYEWNAGTLNLRSVLPDGTPSSGAVAADAGQLSGMSRYGDLGGSTAFAHGGAHAVSDDGSSVFWIPSSIPTPQPLYLSQSGEPTRAVSTQPVSFVGAAHDHSFAYIVSAAALTPGASSTKELYRYDANTGALTLLTGDSVGGAGAQIVYAIQSDDGSHVYFTAYGALTPEAVEGDLNAYVWSAEGIQFIGSFGPQDPYSAITSNVVRVSHDGHEALISTSKSFAGADNEGHVTLYLYDDRAQSLVCVSCRQDGSASEGDASLGDPVPEGVAASQIWRTRNFGSDGQVFFSTTDRLVPGDINSKSDAYEWHDGNLSLLSSGRSDFDSYLADNGDSGRDVFIATRDQLAASDTDQLYDVYDVRAGGGFPEPPQPNPCVEDDCQGAYAGAPTAKVPASRSFRGNAKLRHRAVALGAISSQRRRQLVGRGFAAIPVRVTGSGRVIIRGWTNVRGHSYTVVRGSKQVSAGVPTAAQIRVRLLPVGRRELTRHGRLRVHFSASFKGGPISRRTATLTTISQPR